MLTQLRTADIPHRVLALFVLIGILVVIGCGGGRAHYTIGGTIAGLSGSGLVLLDNGGNDLTVSAGPTSFPGPNGEKCKPETRGLLKRIVVRGGLQHCIGKEVSRFEQGNDDFIENIDDACINTRADESLLMKP